MFQMLPGKGPASERRVGMGEGMKKEEYARDVVASPESCLVELRSLVSHHHHAPDTEKNGQSK